MLAYAGGLEEGRSAYQDKDYAQAFLLLAPLAESGDPEAQFLLGEMYRKGEGLVKNAEEAKPLLIQAAEAGHVPAQLALAQLLENTEGTDNNAEAALQWLSRAAQSGQAESQFQLGLHYIRVEAHRDFEQAAHWLRLAAGQSHPEAQYFYARLVLDGRGVEANADESKLWFERAAQLGQVESQRFLRVLALPEGPDKGLEMRELRRHIAAGVLRLTGISDDPNYGLDQKNPIRAGKDYFSEWAYLNALRGPDGQVVHYRSLSQCCPFDAPEAVSGKGFLDRYELAYEGLAKPAILYFSLFAEDVLPQAPVGFTYALPTRD